MRTQILQYYKHCKVCPQQKVQKTQFERQIFKPGVQPMEFICMDLVGEFHPPSSKGNRYALTAVCMLTGYTFCIPIKNKPADEIVTAWRNHIAFLFGVCRKLLTDNRTEFKNDLFSTLKCMVTHWNYPLYSVLKNIVNFSVAIIHAASK